MNYVSEALSRDDDRSYEEIINIFCTFTPSEIPDHFKIVPLPSKIFSWITSLLQRLPVKEQLRERHTRTNLGRGQDVKKYCGSIRIVEDNFLDHFRRGQRIRLIGASAVAVREGRFSGPSYDTLAEVTVRGDISFVSQTFRENDRPNPTKYEDG